MTPVLVVENLIKTYPSFRLGPVSFKVEAGSIMGFIGRNGAGKTTTLKSILNIAHPNSGSIRYFGQELPGNERAINNASALPVVRWTTIRGRRLPIS